MQSGGVAAKSVFDALFSGNNGSYVRVVRKGNTVSFNFENKIGKPCLMDIDSEFVMPDGTLIRIAANNADGVDDWTPCVKNAEICLGIDNSRYVFGKREWAQTLKTVCNCKTTVCENIREL